jgi:hypothetical protein
VLVVSPVGDLVEDLPGVTAALVLLLAAEES